MKAATAWDGISKEACFFFFGPDFGRIITNGYAFSTLFAAASYHAENTVSYLQSFSACTILKFFIFNINVTIA